MPGSFRISKRSRQYQVTANPVVPEAPAEVVVPFPEWSIPSRSRVAAAFAVVLAATGFIGTIIEQPRVGTEVTNVTQSSPVIYPASLIYQSKAETLFPLPEKMESSWHQPWSEPVRFKRLATAQIEPFTGPENFATTANPDRWLRPLSEPVRTQRLATAQQQSFVYSYFVAAVTVDKWLKPLAEPTRRRGFPTQLQQTLAWGNFTPIGPFIGTETATAAASSPVIFQGRLIYQSKAEPYFVPAAEVVTVDKWYVAWRDPVRARRLATAQYDFYVAPEFTEGKGWFAAWSEPVRSRRLATAQFDSYTAPEFVEGQQPSRWLAPFSEPVRQKRGLAAHLQQFDAYLDRNPDDATFESKWHQPWTEPVRFRRLATAQQQAVAWIPFTEFVTPDKWNYAWSEPVRTRRFPTAQQQALVHIPFVEDTTFESKWHQPWSEPVRFRRLATAQQQALAYSPFFVAEVIYYDKWGYPWSEPVRQKPGLRSSLQTFDAYLDRNPDDATFESKWHQPWAEPVRFRRLATAQIDPFVWPERLAVENIYYDKWGYPWSEPVRQKRGLRPWLQSFDAYLDQNPDFNFESKWHQPWSTPVRFRRLATSQFDFYAAPEFVEGQQPSRWLAPWSEPVRQKRGLRASLQDWFAYLDRNPDDATFESKWHQPWSSPVRFRRISAALQQDALIYSPFFAQEVVTVDKWFRPLETPVRVKSGLFAGRQQFFTASLESVKGVSWYNQLSQPYLRLRPVRFQQALSAPVFVPAPSAATWLRQMAEPVRQKLALRTALQQAYIAPVLDQGQLTRFYNWHAEWALPRQLFAKRVPLIIPPTAAPVLVIANQVELVLDATEVNNDTALFTISVYNPAALCLVSIKEIPGFAGGAGALPWSRVSIEEVGRGDIPPLTIYVSESTADIYVTEDDADQYISTPSSS